MLNQVHNRDWLTNGLPDKSVHLIIADPPYFEVKGEFDFAWPSFEAYQNDVERWALECKRVLTDNGTLFWWGHAKKIAYTQVIFDRYFCIVNNLVWRKTDCQTMRNAPSSMRSFAPITERLLMYSNETDGSGDAENNYRLQIGLKHTEAMEPLVAYFISEMQAAGFTCKKINESLNTCMATHWFARTSQWQLPTESWYKKLRELFNGQHLRREYEDLRREYEDLRREYEDLRRPFDNRGRIQTDVLEYSQESNTAQGFEHDTKKPETLTRNLILTCSKPGDTVLVPFAGSGTECAMAAREGRKFIGFDINQKYAEMANTRAQAELRQLRLF